MHFVKNLQFTRLYKVDGCLKEFNFRKSNTRPIAGAVLIPLMPGATALCFLWKGQKAGGKYYHKRNCPNG